MSDILVHTEAGVMTITFNRVDKKNSITSSMYAELADALATAESEAAVRCVLIQGDPTIFSAGNDIGDFLNALLLGEPFMAEAALEVGLVNRVVPPTEANGIAQTQARKLAAKPLSALVETKRLLKKAQLPAVLERMGEEGASFGRMLREPAAKEAFGAFMEKRKPDFSKL
jgi:enoyl-CoA hydratase/carnithine racemase